MLKKVMIAFAVLFASTASAGKYDNELRNAIVSTGGVCPTVTETFVNSQKAAELMLSVRCSSGNTYLLMLTQHDTKVLPCSAFRLLGGKNMCFVKF